MKGYANPKEMDDVHLSLIGGAQRMLDTATSVWKFSLAALMGSLSVMGAVAVLMYFTILSRDSLFLEGVVFLAIAAWILARSLTGQCCSCCTVEIPRWKRILRSFIRADGTVDMDKQGEGVADSLIQVIAASEKWINVIRQELVSMLIWPVLAIVILISTVFTIDVTVVRIIALGFVGYVFVLTLAVYFGVKLKFQDWQSRIDRFEANTDRALKAI